jgi:hypothetical protein
MTVAPDPLLAVPAPAGRTVREVRHLSLVPPPARYVQGALALTYQMPSGVDAVPRADVDDPDEAVVTPGSIPDPQSWAGRFVQAVVEVIAQQRPISQLARWTAPDVFAELADLHRAAIAQPRDPRVRQARQAVVSVRVFQVAVDSAEVAARVVAGPRSRAIAARLDFRRGRWTCTALSLG